MDALLGITARDWWRLLRENRFAVDPAYWNRAAILTVVSLMNSVHRRREERIYGAAVAKHLADVPSEKRPMDNMEVTFRSPGEDEFATSVTSLRSPVIGWSFPRREGHYEQYLTFREAPEEDVAQWKAAFVLFLKKLTWRYDRPLLLKSPTHTCRIRLLLDLFPDAWFVHMHRNPYTVFQSTQRLYENGISRSYLQRPDAKRVDDGILRRYVTMYNVFFEERALIPDGQFHEVCFEELEKDMVGQVSWLYERLNLPGFQDLKPRLRCYAESVANYKKNTYPPLTEPLRRKIAQAWQRDFEEWGYAI